MINKIAQKLTSDIERNNILSENILECEELLEEINKKNVHGIYKLSFCNFFFKKLGLKFRTHQTKCTDGIYTSFDMDDVFIKDFKEAIFKRKLRIEEHARKIIK